MLQNLTRDQYKWLSSKEKNKNSIPEIGTGICLKKAYKIK